MFLVYKIIFHAGILFFVGGFFFSTAGSYAAAESRGFVTYKSERYRLEIPCGYFYLDYIKSGRWGCDDNGGEFKSVSLLATADELKPYSELTANHFAAYKNGDSSQIIDLLINDISYAPYMDNYNYASAYLNSRRASRSEYKNLTKYIMSHAAGSEYRVIYIDQAVVGSNWVRFVCYRSKYPYCSAFSCKDDICLLYRIKYDLSDWRKRHLAIWDLVGGLKK